MQPSSDPRDDAVDGFAIGCACQIVFFLLGMAGAFAINSSERLPNMLAASWGITQWIALVPLILKQRAKGRTRMVNGLIISGCIGVLLSSACASLMIYGN
jgi:hypothetical protein